MCEETGQVHYSTVQSNVDDPSDHMYAQVNKENKKKATKKKSGADPEIRKGGFNYDVISRPVS